MRSTSQRSLKCRWQMDREQLTRLAHDLYKVSILCTEALVRDNVITEEASRLQAMTHVIDHIRPIIEAGCRSASDQVKDMEHG